ncbi:fused MFS/spermidine synthase [Aquimarina sp. 2201CG5-10]|uniref:spermidine synthase n=1 Tax=Aquimarina callyspongiae TaxID=3098150 RepID=UPI002AB532A3|nr:fused MFS/spermidine synthase [Aquimarina sp. 2201CG5-10]MDY8137927.1 fused MFS/spermidine synthase [Aquimarina sp. 2201CG5-10]
MKKILSYIWPFTKTVTSEVSGPLEITWMNGKKVLDSRNANYSYGNLQQLLDYGLSLIPIDDVSDILLLGLGAGSVIESLRNKFNYKHKITAVEIDKVVIQIAEKEFNISQNDNLKIISQDALDYVNTCQKQYELIILDIFIDNTVPKTFYDIEFWQKVISLLKPGKSILFNAGINLKEDTTIDQLIAGTKSLIQFTKYDNVQGTNTLLIGTKK